MKRQKHVVRATMKTWVLAAVVLSLISVCQPAPPLCERLLQPVDNGPDLSGRWYYIAASLDPCVVNTVLTSGFWPSISLDITFKNTTNNTYNLKLKMKGYCAEVPGQFFYDNKTLSSVDSNNVPTDNSFVLLQSGCPDCIVVKRVAHMNTLALLSRRNDVTTAELNEFEAQIECLGWNKMELLKMDHDYENCKSAEDSTLEDVGKMNSVFENLRDCIRN